MSLIHDAESLCLISRQGHPEIVVHGFCFLTSEKKSSGELALPARSLLKAWQFLACDVADGREDFWAMGFASHFGERFHLVALQQLAQRLGLSPEDSVCPAGLPLDSHANAHLADRSKKRAFHPCAGKHLVMRAACHKHGWPETGYENPDHPLQKKISAFISEKIHRVPELVRDGCGVPSPVLSLKELSMLYGSLVAPAPEVKVLRELWQKNPAWIGGTHTIDTWVAQKSGGNILAKTGADGLLTVQEMQEPYATLILKIGAGYFPRLLELGLAGAMRKRRAYLSPRFSQLGEQLWEKVAAGLGDQTLAADL